MKVSPMANGGMPGVSLGTISTERTSPDRLAAAKAVAAGESPMRIAESDTPIDPQVIKAQESIRKIKMRVNQSPDRDIETGVQQDPTLSATPVVNEEVASEETKPLSPQFAALRKQQRALQVKEREIAERERALQGRHTTDGGTELAAQLKSQPLRVLQEQGVLTPEFYNSLTEFLVSGQSGMNPEILALKEEIKALKEGVDKNFVTRDQQAEESALTEMLYEAEDLAKEGEDYQLIREQNAYDKVLRRIYDHYKKTGRVLDVRDTMNKVENELLDQYLKYANISKVQSKLQPSQPQLQQQRQPQMRTLTNRDTAVPTMDRRARAMLAATGQLKRG